MSIRVQMARLALDPRRPILSLVTVLEEILQIEDPSGEQDRMWEDLANQDPVIVLEQVAQALDRSDEPEMAERIRESRMRAKLIEDLQFRQLTGTVPGGPGGPGGPEGQPPGPGPETGAPQATQRESEERGRQQRGAELVGAMGERAGV